MTSAVLSELTTTPEVAESPTLLDRLRTGDPRAVAEAYDCFHAPARRLARRMVGDTAIAEDLLQEAFLALPKAAQRYEGQASLSTFVLGIVVNLARKYSRAAARRRRAHERAEEHRGGGASDVEHEAANRELATLLWSLLDELPAEQREAFALCAIDGRPSAEAAALVGVPDATLRARLARARKNLKDALARKGYP